MNIRQASRLLLVLLVVATFHSSYAYSAGNAPARLPSDDYLELPYDDRRGNPMKLRGHRNFQVAWLKEMKQAIDMAMSPDHTRVYVANANSVVSFSLSGKVQWKVVLPKTDSSGYNLQIGEDGTVYALSQPTLFQLFEERSPVRITALSPAGKWLWNRTVESFHGFVSNYGDSRGTLILNTADGIAAIRDGRTVWTNDSIQQPFRISPESELVFSNIMGIFADTGGTTFVETIEDIHALDETGNIIWSRSVGSLGHYLVQNGKYLLSVSPSGSWSLLEAATGKELPARLIDPLWVKETGWAHDGQGAIYAGNYYFGERNGISKIDPQGKVLWSYKLRFSGYEETSGHVSDRSGNLIFSDNGGRLYSLDRNGNERFMLVQLSGSPTRSVVDNAGNVYALINGTGLIKISAKAR